MSKLYNNQSPTASILIYIILYYIICEIQVKQQQQQQKLCYEKRKQPTNQPTNPTVHYITLLSQLCEHIHIYMRWRDYEETKLRPFFLSMSVSFILHILYYSFLIFFLLLLLFISPSLFMNQLDEDKNCQLAHIHTQTHIYTHTEKEMKGNSFPCIVAYKSRLNLT